MWWTVTAVLAASGCGRVGFDQTQTPGDGGGSTDVGTDAIACGVRAIAAGERHVCAVRNDGVVVFDVPCD